MRTAFSIGGRRAGAVRYLNSPMALGFLIAAISSGVFGLVWIYGNGLRDPRYLDGWILAAGMGLQLGFHIAVKTARFSPGSVSALRKFHMFIGYVLIAAFISHSDFSWPDTGFEWVLWSSFVLVTLSGLFGTYLEWSLRAKRGIGEPIGDDDRVTARRADLARAVQAIVAEAPPAPTLFDLPAPPHDAWIMDLYTSHLRNFFEGQGHVAAHFIGSERPLKRLTDEIDTLSRYVDKRSQEKLQAIKTLAAEKDRIDFAAVHQGLTKGWLLVHVPVTYMLIVLSVLHILTVYAFSSGDW